MPFDVDQGRPAAEMWRHVIHADPKNMRRRGLARRSVTFGVGIGIGIGFGTKDVIFDADTDSDSDPDAAR